MRELLQDEYSDYEKSLSEPMYNCLRVNTLKISVSDFLKISPFSLTPVPWTDNGFYYDASVDSPSKHPFYYAGLYYLQEPSACLPAATIPIEAGDRVLDICAAPGGKSTELAAKLKGTGLLVSNDISASRLKALQKNMEVFGVRNSIVTCETPENLAGYFEGYFDKILIDAPCSGEGMFRKSNSMITAWEQNGNEKFISIQKSILKETVKMLRPGGCLLYSTCTFDPGEDECQVLYLKELRPDLKIMPIDYHEGFVPGQPEWAGSDDESLKNTFHLFPHKIKGEGHYVALLRSEGDCETQYINEYNLMEYKGGTKEIDEFLSHVNCSDLSKLELRNNKLFLVPEGSPELRSMRIMRRGVYLGELKKNRFEPSQSFAMILKGDDFDNVLSLKADDPRVLRYLRGETLDLSDIDENINDGWVLVCIDKYPLGFGKNTKGTLKNKYLPGWRMMS